MPAGTRLEARIGALIEAMGPIDVAAFMTLALAHPRDGYYAKRAAIGADGDFITAPEISQLFGELVGLALAAAWQAAGRPAARLVELGPGNGTLIADLWRAGRHVPGFHTGLALHLIETSPLLRARQAERLAGLPNLVWHDGLSAVPDDRPLLLVANELLDALPIRQLIKEADGWHEILVDRDAAGGLCLTKAAGPSALGLRLDDGLPPGSVIELSPAREALMEEIAQRLRQQGGLALIIDYGEREPTPGSTLQAVSRHRKVPPLTRPGEVDLTSRVAFGPLALIARQAGLAAYGPLPQGVWLERLGAGLRLERLARDAPPERAARLRAGHARLVAPEAMGELFKVLAVSSWDAPPPGFLQEERMP